MFDREENTIGKAIEQGHIREDGIMIIVPVNRDDVALAHFAGLRLITKDGFVVVIDKRDR
jgi:hypothetical protein